MKVTYDREAEAMYFKFMEGHGKLEELVEDYVFIDRTPLGQVIGIEILNVHSIEDITRKGVQ